MKTTCRCGATWAGMRMEHCTACHLTFSGTTAGDRHRTGDHALSSGPERRRCRTVEEMLDKGLRPNDQGIWTNGGVSPWQSGRFSPSGDGQGSTHGHPVVSQDPHDVAGLSGAQRVTEVGTIFGDIRVGAEVTIAPVTLTDVTAIQSKEKA